MSGFLDEFADAEDAVGAAANAQVLRDEARAMKAAMNALLWDGADHFVTQVNPDDLLCAAKGTCRDFVDYDSNLIAVAHGVPNTTKRATAVLDRVDKGRCSAAQVSSFSMSPYAYLPMLTHLVCHHMLTYQSFLAMSSVSETAIPRTLCSSASRAK